MSHTPGFWEARDLNIWHEDGYTLIATCSLAPHKEQAIDNAKLIAAAPQTAEALKQAEQAVLELTQQRTELIEGLRNLADRAEAYMEYHREKFYSGGSLPPMGLTPSIIVARSLLSKVEA